MKDHVIRYQVDEYLRLDRDDVVAPVMFLPEAADPAEPFTAVDRERTVTRTPRLRAVEAISEPMKPAPITTSRDPGSSSAQRPRILEGAQRVHAGPGWTGKLPGPCPGGNHHAVGHDPCAVVQHDGGASTVEPDRRGPRRHRRPSASSSGAPRAMSASDIVPDSC